MRFKQHDRVLILEGNWRGRIGMVTDVTPTDAKFQVAVEGEAYPQGYDESQLDDLWATQTVSGKLIMTQAENRRMWELLMMYYDGTRIGTLQKILPEFQRRLDGLVRGDYDWWIINGSIQRGKWDKMETAYFQQFVGEDERIKP
jgi:hypothetical protein